MARTVRRQTFDLPTTSRNYPTTETFAQATYAGINENENQFAVDQTSFADAQNMYVDQELALVNRPPFVIGNDRFVIDRWRFGPYTLQLVRFLYQLPNGSIFEDGDPGESSIARLYYQYRIECVSHPMVPEMVGERRKYWDLGTQHVKVKPPEITCTRFARGIFCWYKKVDTSAVLVFFDTTPDANGEYAFVDGRSLLYRPIHETVINGLTSVVEGKNVFLDGYIRRHIRSTESSVNYGDISSASIFFVDKNGAREELTSGSDVDFDNLAKTDGRLLLHTRFKGTAGYKFKAVQTDRGVVFLRYTPDLTMMWISIGGYFYHALPPLSDVLAEPMLTDDGLHVVAFTRKSIAMCKTVRSAVEDFSLEDVFAWRDIEYTSGTDADLFTPVGHFLSDTEYVYLVGNPVNNALMLHATVGGSYTAVLGLTVGGVTSAAVKMRILPDDPLTDESDEGIGAQILLAVNNNGESMVIAKVLRRKAWTLTESQSAQIIDATALFNNLSGALIKMSFVEPTPEGDPANFLFTIVTSMVNNTNIYSRRIDGHFRSGSKGHSEVDIGMNNDIYFKEVEGADDYFSEAHYRVGDVTMDIPTAKDGDIPLLGSIDSLWIQSGDTILSSGLQDDERLEIDEPVGTMAPTAIVPKHVSVLDDYYFTVYDQPEKLYVTSPAQDDLLYADETEAQIFALPITNLHPLSDTTLGIFTQDEIWYVVRRIDSSNSLVHAKPIRTKIPFGCREGDDVITALDGQAIIFATEQGLAALAPQDFVATTEKTLNYISDAIYKTYRDLYDTEVRNSVLYRDSGTAYPSSIKMLAYRYWQIFYRYMDRQILLLDIRNMSWWKWTTPYPIRKILGGEDLSFIFQVDFLLRRDMSRFTKSYGGVTFTLDETKIDYKDDVLPGTVNGEYEELYGNEFRVADLVLYPASDEIPWSFTSQRLHLNAPQNYKSIQALYLNARGENVMHAKLGAKIYRDVFHPQREGVMEILVNEQRTFLKRVNFMHVVSFQYTLASDAINERLRLDSLGVRYEVKEKLR